MARCLIRTLEVALMSCALSTGGYSQSAPRQLPNGVFLDSEVISTASTKVCRFSDGIKVSVASTAPCFTRSPQTHGGGSASVSPVPSTGYTSEGTRILPQGVLLTSEVRSGASVKKCEFSDGVTTQLRSDAPCFRFNAEGQNLTDTPPQLAGAQLTDLSGLSKGKLCKETKKLRKGGGGEQYIYHLRELEARGLTEKDCESKLGKVLVGVLIVGAIVAAGAAAGSGGYTPASTSDYMWSWDRIPTTYGTYTWRCRGHQTGEFADDYRCAGKPQNDYTWPG